MRPEIKYFLPQLPKLLALFQECNARTVEEGKKLPKRFDIVNALLDHTMDRRYLEIGVRDPSHCFQHVLARYKISVDPGFESQVNLADVKLTSDDFFSQMQLGALSLETDRFDVIFIDGLHTAEQVYRDILNSLDILASTGFVVLHDCNPPTHFHARESYSEASPAAGVWNGSTWKAIQRFRTERTERCAVVDSDFGVAIIAKHLEAVDLLTSDVNPFFEFATMNERRRHILNLMSFEDALSHFRIQGG